MSSFHNIFVFKDTDFWTIYSILKNYKKKSFKLISILSIGLVLTWGNKLIEFVSKCLHYTKLSLDKISAVLPEMTLSPFAK